MRFASRKQQNNTKRAGATTKNTHTKNHRICLEHRGKTVIERCTKKQITALAHNSIFAERSGIWKIWGPHSTQWCDQNWNSFGFGQKEPTKCSWLNMAKDFMQNDIIILREHQTLSWFRKPWGIFFNWKLFGWRRTVFVGLVEVMECDEMFWFGFATTSWKRSFSFASVKHVALQPAWAGKNLFFIGFGRDTWEPMQTV